MIRNIFFIVAGAALGIRVGLWLINLWIRRNDWKENLPGIQYQEGYITKVE